MIDVCDFNFCSISEYCLLWQISKCSTLINWVSIEWILIITSLRDRLWHFWVFFIARLWHIRYFYSNFIVVWWCVYLAVTTNFGVRSTFIACLWHIFGFYGVIIASPQCHSTAFRGHFSLFSKHQEQFITSKITFTADIGHHQLLFLFSLPPFHTPKIFLQKNVNPNSPVLQKLTKLKQKPSNKPDERPPKRSKSQCQSTAGWPPCADLLIAKNLLCSTAECLLMRSRHITIGNRHRHSSSVFALIKSIWWTKAQLLCSFNNFIAFNHKNQQKFGP